MMNGGGVEGSEILLCPICGCGCNHLESIGTLLGDDEWEEPQTLLAATDLEWRRNGIVLNYECENGHDWNLRVHQHKGNEYIFCDEGCIALGSASYAVRDAEERNAEDADAMVDDI